MNSMATALVVTMALALGCSGVTNPPSDAASGRSARGSQQGAGTSGTGEGLDLEAMLAPVPEYQGRGRNLFDYGPPPRAAATTVVTTTIPPIDRAPTTAPPRPTVTATRNVRVDVKYAGFVEKKGEDGARTKYAIFLDGKEIFTGAEGETVGNRFTVVTIGLESVTVSADGSSATQRIPLQSN